MARVELKNVNKAFGSVEVLRDIDLTIDDGEFVVLVGPSGCGKSTLLRMIAGLEPITNGTLHVDGALMNDVRPRDRDMAMVFQSYALYPHMNVFRNMGFSLEISGAPAAERKRRVHEAAKILGLEHLLERLPKELSGGQRQRVAMGRALVRNPRAFLFDEPLSNLDAALRVEMRLEIARLHRRLGATMIYVTHDQIEAMTLADRIVVLHGGEVQQIGSPLQLYHHPQNKFVARFIGSPTMNIFPVSYKSGQLHLANGATIALPQDQAPAGTVEIGVRPEHVDLVACGGGDFDAVTDVIEHLGSDTIVSANIETVGSLVVRAPSSTALGTGTRIGVRLMRDHIHSFSSSGNTLNRIDGCATCPAQATV